MAQTPKLSLILISLPAVFLLLLSCARTPQQRYARALSRGKTLLEKKSPAKALLEFQNAVQANPKAGEAYYWLAMANLQTHNTKLAIEALRRGTEADPTYAAAQVKLSELMILTQNQELTQDAEKRLLAVIADNPQDSDALYALAASEVRLANPEGAEKYLHQVLTKSPRNLRSAIALSEMKAAQNDFAAAEQVLKTFLEKTPDSPEAQAALGGLYAWMGRMPEAQATLRKAVRLDPKNAATLLAFGSVQVTAGDVTGAEATFKQIAALPERVHRLAYVGFLMQRNRSAEALAEMERLFKADPDDRVVRTALVEEYIRENRAANASAIVESALKRNSEDAQALLQRAHLFLRAGKYDEAEADLNRSLHGAASAQGHYLLSTIYRDRGSALMQRNELTQALQVFPESLRIRLELVNLYLAQNNGRAALEELKGATEPQKRTAPFFLAQNWALIETGQYGQARGYVDGAPTAARTPDLLLQSAVLNVAVRNLPRARADLEQALNTNPEDLRALSTLVQVYRLQKDPGAAQERIRGSMRQRPNSVPLQIFWASWCFENNLEGEGRQALALAKRLAPRNSSADLLLAGLDIRAGKIDDARQRLLRVVADFPNSIEAQMMLGDIEDSAGQSSRSVPYYKRVLELDARNVRALNNLAYSLSLQPEHVDEALKYAGQAKGLAPDNPEIQDTVGWIYYRKGLYTTAAKELEAALTKQSKPAVKYHLGMTYQKLGKSVEGSRLIAAAVAVDPSLSEER